MRLQTITWVDAVVYRPGSEIPEAVSMMETTGSVEIKSETWVIVKNKKTINVDTGRKHPKGKKATFFCIPLKAVKSIKTVRL